MTQPHKHDLSMIGSQYSQNAEKPRETFGAAVREPKRFGKRREPATITFTRAGKARQFTVSPAIASFALSLAAVLVVGYFGATAYLMFRDDLIGVARTRNARLIHEYEDRIASLRANLDRVTSRQLLDQQAIEVKIAELMQRQEMLHDRNSRIGALLERAEKRGLTANISTDGAAIPSPSPRGGSIRTGSVLQAGAPKHAMADGISLRGGHDMAPIADETQIASAGPQEPAGDLFTSLAMRIDGIDRGQRAVVDDIRQAATARTAKIAKVLQKLKVALPEGTENDAAGNASGVGGPFIAAPGVPFDAGLKALGTSLETLDRMSETLDRVPLANPAPGHPVTSNFGVRIDPFLNRAALHSGIDFGVTTGTPVRATAAGTVVDAGRNGGYGNMVEIDHGDGITTRFAHLSRVEVVSGQKVERGTVIGLSGSTGRSTGPHLHYEVRRKGDAVNPARYLKAGRELAGLF